MINRCATAAFLLLICLVVSSAPAQEGGQQQPLSRIAFGSCANQDLPQPIWFSIVNYQPHLFLMIGDNIYADTRDLAVMRAKYGQLAANHGFRKLRQTCPVLAVWDDHDYGENDAGAEYPLKVESQQIFNDFFGLPADSPRRQRPGVYGSYVIGPEGKRVQVILLDTRYFRSPLKRLPAEQRNGGGPYTANPDASTTMLGEAQWAWLEEQLKTPAEVRIIASSIQVVPNEHGWEMWGNFPHERQRLFELISETGARGAIVISGDRHLGEISQIAPADSGVPYPLYDVTSSSLNQPEGGTEDEVNRFRLGENYRDVNFGTITIDWQADDPTIELEIRNLRGDAVRQESTTLAELRPQA
ncbi:MAG: alkaline phosphatase D family protein [Pirellulales bacterium]